MNLKRLLGLSLVLSLSCGFVSLPIEKVANTSRTDAQAADGKGGWLDLGSNDLSILPAGEARYAGAGFVVPPAGDENAKNCLVLGRRGPETAVLKLDRPVSDMRLFLLHAIDGGPAPETHREIGRIVVRSADGTSVEHPVCVGDDVSAWTSGRSFGNAARGWTEYNFNTQVSLYVSQFSIEKVKPLSEITFSANGTCPWMIVAASVSGKKTLRPVKGGVEPIGEFLSPEPPPADLTRFPAGARPKNVIFIVGDGMGQGAARLTSYYKYGRADAAYFQQLPVAGLCTTFSANQPVTDSAASATAFSTGVKTSNGVLGYQVDSQHDRKHAVRLTNLAELARAKGMGVAILTSDPLFTATTAAFCSHSISRGATDDICAQIATCGYDIVAGSDYSKVPMRPAAKGGSRKDGRDLIAEMAERGYAFVRTAAELAAAPKGAKIFGALAYADREPAVGEAVAAAIGRLADRPEGFFMLAECGDTDHSCHRNDSSQVIRDVSKVEFMAKAAVDFARARGDTLVIVTADHDTGHPSVLRGVGPDGRLMVQWEDATHTRYPVPVHAYGPGAELFEGYLDNTDLAKNLRRLLNLGN